MSMKFLSLIITTTLSCTLLASPSLAQPGGRMFSDRHDGDHPRTQTRMRGEGQGEGAAVHRGRMQRGPMMQALRPAGLLQRLDSDGDGRISFEEFNAAERANAERIIDRMDRNGDGLISSDEIPTPSRGQHQAMRERMAECMAEMGDMANRQHMLADADLDGDGNINLAELNHALEQASVRAFERLDLDGDGFITEQELVSARSEAMGQQAERRDCMREMMQ